MPVLEIVKEKDKAPANVSFPFKNTHRSLHKELIAQVASFFSCRPKAFSSEVNLDSFHKNYKSISF